MFVLVGCMIVVVNLFIGAPWLFVVALGFLVAGLVGSYRPVQSDPVWRKLVRDGVIEDGESRAGPGH